MIDGENKMNEEASKLKGKVLILGTSAPQSDGIRYCQEKGLEVHACGHKRIGIGVDIADKFQLIDIKDKEEVLHYCKENDIDYVYSVGSEIAIPTANHVSKRLGLPYFIEPEMTDLANDKTIWRDRLGDDFFGNIEYFGLSEKEELSEWERFPAIMKPADGQGQRGVRMVNDQEEARSYFDEVKDHSGTGKIIMEEYITGPELSINGFVIDGEVIFLQDTDRISFDEYPGGIIKEHYIPSMYSSKDEGLKEDIHEMARGAIEKLSIDDGPVYIQLKLKDELDPKIIEIAPRLDGCHLWRLIKHHKGSDILDATFRLLFGQKEKAKEALREKNDGGKYKLKFLMEKTEGTVDKKKYDIDEASFVEWYYDQGDKVREVNGFIEKVGYMISPLKDEG